MSNTHELESQIRDLINNPRKQHILLQNTARWSKLCSSLDVIGDTTLAVRAYEESEEPDDHGKKYLILYGILQVLFVQQDAVEHLAEALTIPYTPDEKLNEIREIRNNSVGHPTKRGKDKSFNFISRISMSHTTFDLMTNYSDGTNKYITVDVLELIKSQTEILNATLKNVIEKLKEEEMEHRQTYREVKLAHIFPQTLGYYFEKIYESIGKDTLTEYGGMHVELISNVLTKFRDEMTRRGILEAHDTVEYEVRRILYPLNALKEYFSSPSTSKLNNEDAEIFIFFIKKHIDDLREIAEEIDEDYTAEIL